MYKFEAKAARRTKQLSPTTIVHTSTDHLSCSVNSVTEAKQQSYDLTKTPGGVIHTWKAAKALGLCLGWSPPSRESIHELAFSFLST